MGRKLISVFLTVWVLVMMPVTVFAEDFDPHRLGSISVTLTDPDGQTPIPGAELSLYYLATASLNGSHRFSYIFTDAFADCGCALDDPALSVKLEAFLLEHPVPARTLVTDTDGTVTFTDLPLGLYFVRQTNAVANYAPCTSFLVTVPNSSQEGYVYDVNASPKTDIAKLTAITIKKVWNTDESTSATDSVTVQLRKDDIVIATAVLSDQNKWQVIYANMPESDGYSIVEVDIPDGFVASYSRTGHVFTVTNTAFLIQTGQQVWPIPVLALAGLCLISVGTIVLRKTRNKHG